MCLNVGLLYNLSHVGKNVKFTVTVNLVTSFNLIFLSTLAVSNLRFNFFEQWLMSHVFWKSNIFVNTSVDGG